MLSLSKREGEAVQERLVQIIRSPSDVHALQQALIGEHIRAAVYASSARADESGAIHLVHTTRLTTHVRRNLDSLWPNLGLASPGDPEDDVIHLTLRKLAALGDIVHMGRGFWMASPLRLVEAQGAESLLILGGLPREVAQLVTGAETNSAAASRFVRRCDLATRSQNAELIQSVDMWLGTTEPLLAWTKAIIATHFKRMSRPEDVSAEQLEIYAPDIFRDQRRRGRWLPASQAAGPIPGPRLCRPLSSYAREYARPYYLGIFDFQAGIIALRQSAAVDFEISRRLRFGLDEILQAPRALSILVDGDNCCLDLRFALPEPEVRVLSLGWQSNPPAADGAHRLVFYRAALPIILHSLRRLSIDPSVMHGRD